MKHYGTRLIASCDGPNRPCPFNSMGVCTKDGGRIDEGKTGDPPPEWCPLPDVKMEVDHDKLMDEWSGVLSRLADHDDGAAT